MNGIKFFYDVVNEDKPEWELSRKEIQCGITLNFNEQEDVVKFINDLRKQNDSCILMALDPINQTRTYIHNCKIKNELKLYFKKKGKRYIRKFKNVGLEISGQVGEK